MPKKNDKIKKQQNSFKALKRKNSVSCRFCYKKFKNRFDLIVHNASHITIPVLKQANHVPGQSSKENTKQDINDNKYDLNMNKTHGIQTHGKHIATKQESIINRWNSMEPTSEGHYDNLMKPYLHMCEFCNHYFSNRFELIVHNASHIRIPVLEPANHGPGQSSKGQFDNLMKPAIYTCKFCKRNFCNGFSLIKHQAVHLYVSCALKPQICGQCNRYIPGYPYNLEKHIKNVHRRRRRSSIYLRYEL